MFLIDFVDDVDAVAEVFVVFVVCIESVRDAFLAQSRLWLTLGLLENPIPDACADPLEEPIVLDVIPDARPGVVVEGAEAVDALVEMESLGMVELVDKVVVPAP